MPTPSERLWADSARWDEEPSLEPLLPARPRRPVTLVDTARRVLAGEARRAAVADFLDDLRWARDARDRGERIRVEPPTVDRHVDAYLGAPAEDVAVRAGLRVPDWCRESHRFLDHLWWPSTTPALHARAGRVSCRVPPTGHLRRPHPSSTGVRLRRAEILEALTALGEELSRRGVTAGMYVVGGAAIALAYDERRSTRDVDDVFAPTAEVYRAAARVAAERGLPEGWVNDAVKGFLLGPDPFDTEILEVPGNVLTLLDRMAPARLLTAQVRFFVEAVLDPD